MIALPNSDQTLSVQIPGEWIGEVATLPESPPATDGLSLAGQALVNPIGSAPLSQLAKTGQNIALIVDDFTRQTPVRRLLPLLLTELHQVGVPAEDIRIVIALGSHRPMSPAEIAQKVGSPIVDRYQIVNTPALARDEMVFLGTSSSGIPAWVNRAVAEADLRLGLGMITPHMDAGFTGGGKIILPGVCAEETVDAFHARAASFPGNPLGDENTPLRLDLEQFVSERIPLHFILNVITNRAGSIYQCVAGHFIQAHRAGVGFARQVYGVRLRGRYPLVVANCHPYQHDLWQSMKGLWCGDLATADGGSLVWVTQAPEGNSNYPLLPEYIGRDPDVLKRELDAGIAADPKSAATGIMVGRIKRRVRLVLVSSDLTRVDAREMGIDFFASVEEAIQDALHRLPVGQRQGSLVILPEAGIVLPITS